MNSRKSIARALWAPGLLVLLASGARAQCLDWSDAFGPPGVDGAALASIVFDDGLGGGPRLIVGGQFGTAGSALARGVARWNGQAWEPLGSGLGGATWPSAQAFAIHDDGSGRALYAAGGFTKAGGVPAQGIARWDGVAWSAVGGGLNGTVRALAVYDDGLGGGAQLYAGGHFTLADGLPAQRLARWNGWSWSEVGGGVPGVNASVYALLVHDDGSGSALFVAGSFGQVGATPAANVARWNGLAFSTLASGTNSAVMALAIYDPGGGPELFVGGEFTSAGGAAASRIARWSGAGWSPLGAGVNDTVRALGVHDDGSGAALIVGGQFGNAGAASARGIARWRSSGWTPLGAGFESVFSPSVWTVCSLDPGPPHAPQLVAGGGFSGAGTTGASNLAAWDGADWAPLGAGLGLSEGQGYGTAGPHAFAVYDSGQGNGPELHMGGVYRAAGTTLTSTLGMARWDGAGWHAFPAIPGLSGAVGALAVFDPGSGPGLYMGENFGVAMWNGVAWDLGQSFALHGSWGGAYAMAVHDDGGGPALYVGGSFTDGCFSGKLNILRWDGTSCSAVGSGPGVVRALVEFDDGTGRALYAAGETSIFPPSAGYVARWDGVQWTQLGAGMDYQVNALAVFDDGSGPALYAGGRFRVADGAPAFGIARWNGATWIPVGGGITAPVSGRVNALAVHSDSSGAPALYAAGWFQKMGSVPAASIARWDGASWSALGLGIDMEDHLGAVQCLRSFDDGSGPRLWAGGTFSIAGGRPSLGIARWGEPCGCTGTVYCSAKVDSAGCVPALRAVGDTRLGGTRPFLLIASPVLSSVSGLLFYGLSGTADQPFVGGTLCVRPPLTRMAVMSSGGNPPPSDCSGVLSLDFKAYALSGADPRLTAGTSIHAQYWYRDPASAGGSGTTDAVSFTLCP